MSHLAKIVVRSTNGDEMSCSVRYDGRQGLVALPSRIAALVDHLGNGDEHVLLLVERGFEYPLVRENNGIYRVDRSHVAIRPGFLEELKSSIVAPTKDQRLQHGRYCHTLSISAVVGAVGYGAGLPGWTVTSVINCASLLAFGVVLFAVGAVLSKGEK